MRPKDGPKAANAVHFGKPTHSEAADEPAARSEPQANPVDRALVLAVGYNGPNWRTPCRTHKH